jgi:uncharacterized protein (TIGR02466 family)
MELHNLFSQPIGVNFLQENLKELHSFSLNLKESRKISNVGGFQSKDLNYKKNKLLNNLIKNLNKYINDYSKIFSLKYELAISNIWININNHKDFNLEHTHPDSIISGSFYIKVPENSGNIIFHNQNNFYMDSKDVIIQNEYNSMTWGYEPKENLLLLFPSWLKHHVEPNMSNEARISMSFNTFYNSKKI